MIRPLAALPLLFRQAFSRIVVLAAASAPGLAGCGPAPQSALPLPPAFYPSALAIGEAGIIVGSGFGGEVVRVASDGAVEWLRAAGGEPVLRVDAEVKSAGAPAHGAVWILLAGRVERRAQGGGLLDAWILPAGFQGIDLAVWRSGSAFVLGADGRVLRVLPEGVKMHARVAASRVRSSGAASSSDPAGLFAVDGALAVFPEAGALLAANDAGAWRIDAAAGEVRALDFWPGFTGISQLVRTGEAAGRHRIAVLRGGANEVRLATITRDLRRVVPVAAARAAHEAPYRGAWDGRTLHVLLGGLDHHPRLAGDGRPRPHRVARWSIGAEPLHSADLRAARPPPISAPARP